MEKVTGMVLDHALQWGAQMLIVWFVGLSLGYLLPRPRWLQKGLVWKELALQTTTGSWFKRVTLALHALLVVREILLRLCPPGTFQAAWRSLWPSTQVSAFAAAAAVACVDDAADAPRLALAAGSHAPHHPADAEWWITESDWQVFRDACEGEGAPGQPRWEDMCRKEFPDCIYTAQRRTLHCGRTEYRSTTVLRDAGAEAVMDFYLDDDVRAVWDPMISEHSLVESRAVAGNPGARCQVVRWLRTFPFAFISSREYVLGRRVFRDAATGALYGITRSVDHPGVRRCGRHVRMEDCHSMWRSRSVEWPGEPGRRAAETVLLHFEDLGIPEHVARFAIRHGMVGFLKRMLPEARAFLARRAEKLDVDEPDPDAYARRVAAGADGGCLLLSQAHGVASQAHPLPPRADADGAADSTEASSWSSRGSSVSMPSMRRLGTMVLASSVAVLLARSGAKSSASRRRRHRAEAVRLDALCLESVAAAHAPAGARAADAQLAAPMPRPVRRLRRRAALHAADAQSV
ncbi:CGL111 [Auxenochlorella protothecoides x Auxenochlorella symbiontica]